MKNMFPFDTVEFRAQIDKRRRKDQGVKKLKPLTRTEVWYWWLQTSKGKSWGQYEEMIHFFNDPPIHPLMIARSDWNIPTVVVTGTNADIVDISYQNPLTRRASIRQVYTACLEHGLKRLKLLWSSQAETFWECFFNEKDFLGQSTLNLPKLIVTTGSIRTHDYKGNGMTLDSLERLEQIGKKWKIPVVQLC